MRNSRSIGRIIALAAMIVAVAALAIVLIGSGTASHAYKLYFQNASQLVKGNLVQVAGNPIGKVSDIKLSPNGQAEIDVNVSGRFTPLREGTQAVVRASSLSGIANRYIDLTLPPDAAPKIPNGGVVDASHTTSAVDLDQIFNVFGPRQRRALSQLIQGFGNTYAGQSQNANQGFLYLNPALASTARLFSALDSDKGLLRRFIDANARFVTDVAARQNDLAGLVDNLATTTNAIARQRTALSDAVATLPGFMRRSNSTFVDLRAALNDLTPLVNESKPVAKKLRPFLAALRPLARDARPTVHDLSRIVKLAGPNNDLIDLTNSAVPVRNVALGPVSANGAQREGAFPASTKALNTGTPEVGFVRPYAPDITGWFSGFSDPGIYDALGAASRVATYLNASATIGGTTFMVPPALRAQVFGALASQGQNDRCPGAAERNPFTPPPGFECTPSQLPPGP